MNRSKQKGTAFETAVVDFLKANGHPYVERRALRGNKDCGDLAGLASWTVELKNHKSLDLGPWCDEAACEAGNAATRWWAVIHKRKNRNVRDSYVTLPLWLFAELLADEPRRDGEHPMSGPC